MTVLQSRPTLGPHMSLICFQHLRLGTEDVAGRAPIVASGRQRGYKVIEELDLVGKTSDAALIQEKLANVLGANGTRLCLVQGISSMADGSYEVRISEAACTAGQTSSEPVCAFTLGVFVGAIHAITGKRMRGVELVCSACGSDECVYRIEPIE